MLLILRCGSRPNPTNLRGHHRGARAVLAGTSGCSAMSEKYLGPTFDIHGGGIDLRFPHHENEQAQSQGVHGPGTFARYWMHNGFIGFRWVYGEKLIAEGSKIAKSDEAMRKLYHMFVARNCIDRHGGEAVRLWL